MDAVEEKKEKKGKKEKRNSNSQRLNFLSVDIIMNEPLFNKKNNKFLLHFVIKIKRGWTPQSGKVIQEIWIGGKNYKAEKKITRNIATTSTGNFSFDWTVEADTTKKISVAVVVEDKWIQQTFDIPEKPRTGANWIEVGIGDPAIDGKVKGRIIVKTSKNGKLATGEIRVSSNRPFSIEENNIINVMEQKREWFLTVKGEMLFELEMSRIADHLQQQIFFILLNTGQEIKKFLAKRQ